MPAAELICDISRSGNLLEFGSDPLAFGHGAEAHDAAVQTEVGGSPANKQTELLESIAAAQGRSTKSQKQEPNASAAQVLRMAVGLLGLELHQRPSSWSEAWLTFEDTTARKLGLSSFGKEHAVTPFNLDPTPEERERMKAKDSGSSSASTLGGNFDGSKKGQVEWQQQVLGHLRRLYDSKGAGGGDEAAGVISMALDRTNLSQGGEQAPAATFREQLDLSEFCLRRITHAVNVLQDPERHDRPLILREYTEEMVLEVCKDLKQWLEQLSTLLSYYHVQILDLETERRQLSEKYGALESKNKECEEVTKDAVLRHNRMEEYWQEEKMKRRAEALLGIKLQGEDAKIYSQRDVDEMMKQWEKDQVQPLLEEIKELRKTRDELYAKLQGRPGPPRASKPGEPQEEASSGGFRQVLTMMSAAAGAAAEKVESGELSSLLSQVSQAILAGGGDLKELIADIKALPPPEGGVGPTKQKQDEVTTEKKEGKPAAKGGPDVSGFLGQVAGELDGIAATLKKTKGLEKIGGFTAWAKDSINAIKNGLSGGQIKLSPAPKWDLKALGEQVSKKDMGVNTTAVPQQKTQQQVHVEHEPQVQQIVTTDNTNWEAKLRALRDELEKQIQKWKDEAEKQRLRAEEALQRLAEETKRADQMLAELRKRLQEMERLLQKAGLGKEAADAIFDSGLADFMQGRDVFDRLYRDALRRMRSQAEAQARLIEESSAAFLRVLNDMAGASSAALDYALMSLQGQRPEMPFPLVSPLQVHGLADPRTPQLVSHGMTMQSGVSSLGHPSTDSAARKPRSFPIGAGYAAQPSLQQVAGDTEGLLMINRLSQEEKEASGSPPRARSGLPPGVGLMPKAPLFSSPDLPPLQVAGRGELIKGSTAGARIAARTAAMADGCERGGRSGSPSRSASPQRSFASLPPEHSFAVSSLSALSSQQAPRAGGGSSRLLPPGMAGLAIKGGMPAGGGTLMRGSPAQQMKRAAAANLGHSASGAAASEVLKSAGSMSMPQLSPTPPRLLVQVSDQHFK
eukprot:TRINITY_DN94794_c0_g1_i1.p1 TRINITY_DN94794_c0_g1~~TRINITY_DN94794_c0_g1_i1.p1  ORF type:complete len:1024 (-),score=271.82 TRINITY_DN94794_c0_g1_i1:297-3368(-)